MSDDTNLTAERRALLDKYLSGQLARTTPLGPRIMRRATDSLAPLSAAQQQFWLMHQLAPDAPVYNETVTICLPDHLDVPSLERSLNEIIRRHEIWRTVFPLVEGTPVQRVLPHLTLSLPVSDLRSMPEVERLAAANRIVAEQARRPFDLVQGPLLRATLLRSSDAEYRLYVTLHHIIFDGVSMYQVFFPELRALYDAFATGQPSPLPELPIQYGDFAQWQHDALLSGQLTDHLNYWRQQLAGAEALAVPTDRPRPAIPSHRGSVHSFAVPQSLYEHLIALGRREGATPFMTLYATFAVLLCRYTGQDDIVLGTAAAGRRHPDTQALLGLFMNTLVLRTNLAGDPTFGELLRRVRQVVVEAQSHEDVPFGLLVNELRTKRDPARNPLFQVLLVLEPDSPQPAPGWTLSLLDVAPGISKFDFSLILEQRPTGLLAHVEYSTDLFDAGTIERMVGHWQALLAGIVADPGRPISRLPMLPEAERHQLVEEWNATTSAYPTDQCIHSLVAAQAQHSPTAPAVRYLDQQLTYGELEARANQLAHHLRGRGVGPDVLVGLCVERSLDLVVGMLGILKAGGAYVPLDPTYPRARLAFMCHDAALDLVLTQRRLDVVLPESAAQRVYLDDDWPAINCEPVTPPHALVQPHNLAYVIYTSGSTGQPKGVLIEHQSLVCSTSARGTYYREPVARYLLLSSFAFDSSVAGIFWTLGDGGTLVLPRRDMEREPAQLAALIAAERISHLLALPSLYALLLAQAQPGQLDSLRTVIVAGETCPGELANRHRARLPATAFYNEYGPTEATVWSTVFKVEAPVTTPQVPLGRPSPNIQVYLLDHHGQLVPVGVTGELHIGGPALARGYHNRPALTAQRFIPDPFASDAAARLYRTGDLGRARADGTLEFLGRRDDQVKLHGYRIELGEVEAALCQHPDVLEAAVARREDAAGSARLVGYIVPRHPTPPAASALHDHLHQRLPPYMVPAAFVVLRTLPRSPNGKLSRGDLPALDAWRSDDAHTEVAPRTSTEAILARIWADLLRLDRVSVADSFFELGGDSLMAMQAIARLNAELGLALPVASLFESPTIATLASVAERALTGAQTPPPQAPRQLPRDAYRRPRPSD